MLIECQHPQHEFNAELGPTTCPDPECLVAAIYRSADPMDRLPAVRPDWFISTPDRLDHREVEALARLGDCGLIPQIVDVESHGGEEPVDFWPTRSLRQAVG